MIAEAIINSIFLFFTIFLPKQELLRHHSRTEVKRRQRRGFNFQRDSGWRNAGVDASTVSRVIAESRFPECTHELDHPLPL
jgi:hypothetical protein